MTLKWAPQTRYTLQQNAASVMQKKEKIKKSNSNVILLGLVLHDTVMIGSASKPDAKQRAGSHLCESKGAFTLDAKQPKFDVMGF